MISSIYIEGYRGFRRFEMAGLGRVNLLVGSNNGGKTSVLETIDLLMSRGDPVTLWGLLSRRGETLTVVNPIQSGPAAQQQQWVEIEVSHLFTDHEIHSGSQIIISAKNETPARSVTFIIEDMTSKEREDLSGVQGLQDDPEAMGGRLALRIRGTPTPPIPSIPLSRVGGISTQSIQGLRRSRRLSADGLASHFITTESWSIAQLIAYWDRIALTPSEDLVLKALSFLDPDIERIVTQSGSQQYFYGATGRGGFLIKRKGVEKRLPIGSMGEGMWRMLAMAIAITQSKDGVLLVDEIDTGLHYSVLADMWRLIFNAAKEFNVQVFATTHSYDCIYSLAHVCAEADIDNPITVQRIEAGKSKAIPYGEDEIKVAADREIEVR